MTTQPFDQQQPGYIPQQPYNGQNFMKPNMFFRSQSFIKGFFSRQAVLVVALLQLCMVICNILLDFLKTDSSAFLYKIVNYIEQNNYFDADFINSFRDAIAQDVSQTTSLPSIFLGAIVSFAFILPYFLLYTKSKNNSVSETPRGPITFFYVISIMAIIGLSIGILGCTIGAVALIVFMSYYNTSAMTAAAIIAIIFVVFLIAFIISQIFAVRYFNSIKKSLSAPRISAKGAKGFGTLSIIFGIIIAIFSIATIFVTFNGVTAYMTVHLISILISAAYSVLWGFIAYDYAAFADEANRKMDEEDMCLQQMTQSGNNPIV